MPSEPPTDLPSEPPTDLPPAPAEPPAPVSPVKEWAVALALMIVFALICAQFIGFLRANQFGP